MKIEGEKTVISLLIGLTLGVAVTFSFPWENWPDVNHGLQYIFISTTLFIYGYSSDSNEFPNIRDAILGIFFGVFCGLFFQLGEAIHSATVLLLVSISLTYFGDYIRDGRPDLASQFLFAGIPISVLSIISGGPEIFEIAVTAAILIAFFWNKKVIIDNFQIVSMFAPLSIVLGAWIFREQNGNLEFAGVDAAFNISLVIACYFALYYERSDDLSEIVAEK